MTKIRVTDHAILRYLERAGGFDIDRMRREITSRIERVGFTTPGHVRIDGMTFVVKDTPDGPIVTTAFPSKRRRHP